MTYDKEFEEMINCVLGVCTAAEKNMVYLGWTEARKDHYRIGEEVESQHNGSPWRKAVVGVYQGTMYKDEVNVSVRRIPAKSRIDEIAEEAVDKYRRGAVGAGSLTDIIKSAILKDREERGEK